jgi:hypothetical protein
MEDTPNTAPKVDPAPATPQPAGSRSLVDRAKNILLQPKSEWGVIDGEPATIGGLYTGYIMILAAIGPVAGLIGSQLFGYSALGFTYKPPLGSSLAMAVLSYVMSLVSVYVLALIIDALAPTFNGTKNQIQAFKVAAYSMTAAWLAGIFGIIPALAILGIVGLYSLYLLYLGLPRLMRVSEDKAIGYTVLVIVAAIVLYFIVAYIVAMLTMSMFGGLGSITGPVIR